MSESDMSSAFSINQRWHTRVNNLFSQTDLLCLPSAAVFPFDAQMTWPTHISKATMQTYHEWMSVVIPASLQGLPTLAVPAGFNNDGLPAGIQLMGKHGDDIRVLRAGQLYHQATGWPQIKMP